ncbi:MAG: tail assembly protein [Proteobacteria bacterium]|nr:MAG: tail assembly protein [Pseudomonadota bacterium]
MVKIKFHGFLGNSIKSEWKLAVKSVSEAFHAINQLTNNKLNKLFYKHKNSGFHVLVNGRKLERNAEWNVNNPDIIDKVKESEFNFRFSNLDTIDILPVIEFAGSDFLTVLLGALLIVVGVLVTIGTLGGGALLGAALIIGGIGVLAAGTINLLSKPPKSEDFREIQNGGKSSYLFSGPQNVINEGGPVPVGYGRLIIGSQVISASYKISNIPVNFDEGTLPAPEGLLIAVNLGGSSYAYFQADQNNSKFAYKASLDHIIRETNVPFTITPNWPSSAPGEIYKTSIQSNNTDACNIEIDLGTDNSLRDVMVKFHFVNYFSPTKQFRVYMDKDFNTMESNYPNNRIKDHLGNLTFDLDSYSIPRGGSYVLQKRTTLSSDGKFAAKVNRDAGAGSFAFCAIEIYDYNKVNIFG